MNNVLSMKQTWLSLLAAITLSTAMGLPSAANAEQIRPAEWATPVSGTAPNLFQITPTFYRSAQLSKTDIPTLKTLGIKNVVGLRAFHSDKEWLKDSGIKAYRVKIYTWAISDDNVVAALKAIRTAEQEGPVLLHCQHGADRTGLISAVYRVIYQGWTKEQALDELKNGGYGYHAVWKNIPPYLMALDVENIRRRVEKE